MKIIPMIGGLGIILTLVSVVSVANDDGYQKDDVEAILNLHAELLDAHKDYDVGRVLASEPDEIVVVSRGEVSIQTRSERAPRFERYLQNTRFEEYRDLIDPIVRVSRDGTLGWLIAQVQIVGDRAVDGDGERERFEWVWAWIELYEKMDGRWYRVGEVSNTTPAEH